jgi:hypothetical protein
MSSTTGTTYNPTNEPPEMREDYRSGNDRAAPHVSHRLRDIVAGIAQDAQDLVRGEIALARAEADRKIDRIITAAIWVVGGMLLGFAALVIFAEAAIAALSRVLPVWASCLIIGAIVAVVGAALARTGIRMLSLARLAPYRTARNLGRDAQMVKDHTT